jgi:hypothetical protein
MPEGQQITHAGKRFPDHRYRGQYRGHKQKVRLCVPIMNVQNIPLNRMASGLSVQDIGTVSYTTADDNKKECTIAANRIYLLDLAFGFRTFTLIQDNAS